MIKLLFSPGQITVAAYYCLGNVLDFSKGIYNLRVGLLLREHGLIKAPANSSVSADWINAEPVKHAALDSAGNTGKAGHTPRGNAVPAHLAA